MPQLNPQYEAIFDPRNIDEDCDKIADEISDDVRMQIKEFLRYEVIMKYGIDSDSRKTS